MSLSIPLTADTGLEVIDAYSSEAFKARRIHMRDVAMQMEGMRRIAHAFVQRPESMLQELVNAAVELCGADSAGISIEKENGSESEFYHWVATSGQYTGFMNAILPRYPSACGICLERGRPQVFRVRKRFFDIMGIEAPTVTDGLLLPWQVDATRGTIFIMAHGREEAFDLDDCRMMETLADFAAMGVRQKRQQERLMQQAGSAAASAMAHELAHKINNPLQTLTNVLYLASEGQYGDGERALGARTLRDLEKLSALVKELLSLPYREKNNKTETQ